MPDLPLLAWLLILSALVLGILAGHFGWGKRWTRSSGKLHPDYLTGLGGPRGPPRSPLCLSRDATDRQ